ILEQQDVPQVKLVPAFTAHAPRTLVGPAITRSRCQKVRLWRQNAPADRQRWPLIGKNVGARCSQAELRPLQERHPTNVFVVELPRVLVDLLLVLRSQIVV